MTLFSKQELEAASALIYNRMAPTPQISWPLLERAVGSGVWVKHENHTPTGSFKLRGALTFIDWLTRSQPGCPGIITATRGNHGQGQALAATMRRLSATVYVPKGNSVEKNASMEAFGAKLVEFGHDFDTAKAEATRVSEERGLTLVPPFHRELVRGVATCGLELLAAKPDIDTVYVPIGCGSGVCGMIAARDALGLGTKIVGVVAEKADCVKRSMDAGGPIETAIARTFADGIAIRVPVPEAFDIYSKSLERVISVSEDEIADAVRLYYQATHNLVEGAGAASLAGLLKERARMAGRKAGVVVTGGNIDRSVFKTILNDETPVA